MINELGKVLICQNGLNSVKGGNIFTTPGGVRTLLYLEDMIAEKLESSQMQRKHTSARRAESRDGIVGQRNGEILKY
jgi:hypothetical protein